MTIQSMVFTSYSGLSNRGLICLIAATLGSAGTAEAQLALDAGWYNDHWRGTLPVFSDDSPNPESAGYAFTLFDPAILTVTDAYATGDVFNVYDEGDLIGTTEFVSIPAFGDLLGEDASDFDPALENEAYSSLQTLLSPGTYQLSFETIDGLDSGGFGVRLDSIPEPVSALLAIGPIIGMMFVRKR